MPHHSNDFTDQYKRFLTWERQTRDTIDVKRVYVEMAGDAATGLLFSQIVYYYLPAADGSSKLRIEHDGHFWIAKRRKDWWAECRLRPKQADRAIAKLRAQGLVETATYKFHDIPIQHVRLVVETFLKPLADVLSAEMGTTTSPNGEPVSRNAEVDFPNRGSPPYKDYSSKTWKKKNAKKAPELTIEQMEAMTDEELDAFTIPFDPHKSNLLTIQVAAIKQDRRRAKAST